MTSSLGNGASLAYMAPEGLLGATVAVAMASGVALRRRGLTTVIAVVLLLAAFILSMVATPPGQGLFHGMIVADWMLVVFRPIFILAGLLAVAAAYDSAEVDSRDMADMVVLVAASVLGMCLLAGASDLLMMYLAMEMVGILSYVLAGLRRKDQLSSEAALKYAIYGGAASGVMLFGLSLLYGISGDTSLLAVREAIGSTTANNPIALLAMTFVLAGLAYKVAAVPFHMWCPDVYQGAPTPVTAFFSVAPKAAGFAMLMRILSLLFAGALNASLSEGLSVLVAIVAVATMTMGNLQALGQSSVKRLLAYSSIAHAGYIMLGVTTLPAISTSQPDYTGFRAVFFYLVLYLFMNLGAFFAVSFVVTRTSSDRMDSFRALGQRSPFVAAMLTIFLLSLAGIPPTAGFVGKFYLFYALLAQGGPIYFALALVGVLNSFLSLFYYARVLKAMYLEPSEDRRPIPLAPTSAVVLAVLAAFTLLFGVYFGPVQEAAGLVLQ